MAPPPPSKPDAVLALTTIGGLEDGRSLARGLVESRLVACVNLLPDLTSIYRWRGGIEEEAEILLLIKTTRDRLPEMRRWIDTNHPYEVPELLLLDVDGGSADYLAWLREAVTPSEGEE
ncbi:MAG: divalent cation tolerance protein CutA [Candidatus Eisenbacteria bacterium]|nr:divalent cation tolerance protein CutA [Candidatus Latescibacterota bacterium]MBD3302257.1 divalent cation tolerance protein CutA [Candidatus Eisenbacteria bacterium]